MDAESTETVKEALAALCHHRDDKICTAAYPCCRSSSTRSTCGRVAPARPICGRWRGILAAVAKM